jgi:CheY-like chemotaxis protein
VLVLDDDADALELVRLTLEPRGWDVRTSADASSAVSLVRRHRPAVLLVDLLMPGTDGFAVVDAVRADPSTAATPIVVLTAADLTPGQRRRLLGQIEFITSKAQPDLTQLSSRLAALAPAPGTARGRLS